MYTVSKEPTNDFGLKNVILLPRNYRHVSGTQANENKNSDTIVMC